MNGLNFGGVDVTQRARHGSECQLYNNHGGCDGYDSGRCGLTQSGELYAYYHDAVAWCEEDNPECGFRMGPLVRRCEVHQSILGRRFYEIRRLC